MTKAEYLSSLPKVKIDNAKTPVSPANNQANEEIMASPITIGTKYDEIISAILAIGAFCP